MSHMTIAASASTFEQMFVALRQSFTFTRSDSADFGPFSASYSVAAHLEGGSVAARIHGGCPKLSGFGPQVFHDSAVRLGRLLRVAVQEFLFDTG